MSTLAVAEKLAIHELLARAAYALDERDMTMLAAAFAPDAQFTLRIAGGDLIGPFVGRDGIMQLMTSATAAQTDKRRHVISNMFFETATEHTAVVVSNLTLMATEHGVIQLLSAGVYRDEVIKGEGGWQLLRRHLDLDKTY
jgi:3-phenylpropionate/cinnamic acid dioxygenase small subunit